MPKPGNPFSRNILPTTQVEESSSPVHGTGPSEGSAAKKPSSTLTTMPPKDEATVEAPETKPGRSSAGAYDYRTKKILAGKKAISLVIDEDLRMEIRTRMMFRKLTWDTLVEGLLRQWLEENPGIKP